jgi:prepilin-type N-terminal cleavage/methylation domain-containing protein
MNILIKHDSVPMHQSVAPTFSTNRIVDSLSRIEPFGFKDELLAFGLAPEWKWSRHREKGDRAFLIGQIRKGAFTLIELIVTLAVIGILAGFLMPVLGVAKRKAESARCVSNLRQAGIAVRLFADDNEGRLPRARALGGFGANTGGEFPAIEEVLAPYLGGSREVFRCPADKEGKVEEDRESYEWNSSLNGRILHRIGQDRPEEDAVRTFLLRDREGWHPRGKRNAVFSDGRAGTEDL